MAQLETEIEGLRGPNGGRAAIVWVLEADRSLRPGTAEACRGFMDAQGSMSGLCVGDGETMPEPAAWDDGDVAVGRGFDVIVRRSDMRVLWSTTHGTTANNENIDGEAVRDAVQAALNDAL